MMMYLLIKTFNHFARDNTWSYSKYFEQLRKGKGSECQELDLTYLILKVRLVAQNNKRLISGPALERRLVCCCCSLFAVPFHVSVCAS